MHVHVAFSLLCAYSMPSHQITCFKQGNWRKYLQIKCSDYTSVCQIIIYSVDPTFHYLPNSVGWIHFIKNKIQNFRYNNNVYGRWTAFGHQSDPIKYDNMENLGSMLGPMNCAIAILIVYCANVQNLNQILWLDNVCAADRMCVLMQSHVALNVRVQTC